MSKLESPLNSGEEDMRGIAQPHIREHKEQDQSLNSPDYNNEAEIDERATTLEELGVRFMSQDIIEENVARKLNMEMLDRDMVLDRKRLEKLSNQKNIITDRISSLESKLQNRNTRISQKESIRKQVEDIKSNDLGTVLKDIKDVEGRLRNFQRESATISLEDKGTKVHKLPNETEQAFLIRTGKITPFSSTRGFKQIGIDGENYHQEEQKSHKNLRIPEINNPITIGSVPSYESEAIVIKRKHINDDNNTDSKASDTLKDDDQQDLQEYKQSYDAESEDEFINNEDSDPEIFTTKAKKKGSKKQKVEKKEIVTDDGDELFYQLRLSKWISRRQSMRTNSSPLEQLNMSSDHDDKSIDEWLQPHPSIPDATLDHEYKVPGDVYESLFEYQKTGIQWLWELYSQKAGGIIGDEMGLGKTIQIISFLAGLHHSGKLDKPVLIVCPATVMRQWVNEFHRWWPPFRTVILHSIGSGMHGENIDIDLEDEGELLESNDKTTKRIRSEYGKKTRSNGKAIVDRVFENGHVLITTYVGLKVYGDLLLPQLWGYCVLDEGHNIRNPNADISLICKQVKTWNRIILSGTPIQNNLIELWSLFDFVFPGRLGTLPVFKSQFSIPINLGGYANATNVQVQTAYKCAIILRDLISPYLLRRMKVDVASDLPHKSEKVLFCKLTKQQRDAYIDFLKSEELKSILDGKRQALYGIDILRKICNHPDLVNRDILRTKPGYTYGAPNKSGKMQVIKALIQLWVQEGHRTLLFSQTKQMLDILETFISKLGVKFLRMDGSTPIGNRQSLVDTFNNNLDYHVFLLTTKVGGLGINLTGADRVIIFDPDWNPSTDMQARERAWRLGQKKDVTIYRLMTAGCIEEKIYHRQIFKQFLTNKILKDPKQRRFFKTTDLHNLFALGDGESSTETGIMFKGTETRLGEDVMLNSQPKKNEKDADDFYQVAEMAGVSSIQDYHANDDGSFTKELKSSDDDRIMEGLFANSGVHSTLEHDAVMTASRPDTILIEKEAVRVAQKAAEMLKASRKATRKANIGTPTWTGRFGTAGKFGRKKSQVNDMSSSSILENIRKKRELEGNTCNSAVSFSSANFSRSINMESQKEIIEKLRNFLSQQDGFKASSQDIVQRIGIPINESQDIASARQMLKQISDWDNKSKLWVLKDGFRDQ